MFFIGREFESYYCVGFLENGGKFVRVNDYQTYQISQEQRIWVEKLPNGLYRKIQ